MNKPSEKRFTPRGHAPGAHPLKVLTPAQFAALGAGSVVFRRQIRAGELAEFIPQAALAPSEQMLELLMSADGVPVLIADSVEAVTDWIDGHEVRLATLH